MLRRTALLGGAAALAATTLPFAPAPAVAQTGAPVFHRTTVGAFEVFVVSDGFATRPVANHGVVNASAEQAIAALRAAGVQGDTMEQAFNVTIVRTPRGLVMLDAGRGAADSRLQASMRAAGLDPAQIVQIIHTHFHGDHIGGLTTNDGNANFANVPVSVPQPEWDFWMDEGQASRAPEAMRGAFTNARRRLAPYGTRVERFASNAEVLPGITAIPTPGHTPGHVSFLIADGGQQLIVTGDAVTIPALYLANPEWVLGFDMDRAQTVESRRRLLDRAVADRIPVIGYHFPMPATGRVERAGTGYRLVPANA